MSPSTFASACGRAVILLLCLSLWIEVAAGADTLYARLGGEAGVHRIVVGLLDRSFSDPRTRSFWEGVDRKRLEEKLAAYLCVQTGGGCTYENDDLRTIHAGLHIHQSHFYALVEMLRTTLDEQQVGEADKNALLALLAPTRRDVVQP